MNEEGYIAIDCDQGPAGGLGLPTEAADLYSKIVENLTEGVVVADVNYNFKIFNRVGIEICGLGAVAPDPDSWVEQYGLFLGDGVTPCPTEEVPLMRAIQGEVVTDMPMFLRNPHRPRGAYLSISARPLRNAAGEIVAGMVIFRDVSTERRALDALRASEEKWRSLVENAPDFILTVDLDYNIQFINRSSSPAMRSELLGTCIFNYMEPPEARAEVERVFERVRDTGAGGNYEVRGRGPDGHVGWFDCRIGPIIVNGKVTGFTVVATDATEKRANREALALAYAEMENRVNERTDALRRLNSELKASRDELRSLNDRIMQIQEEERTRIAREIHDVFGQSLTTLKYDIAWLKTHPSDPDFDRKLGKMDQTIDATIQTVRRISSELRPGVLDDLGLVAAIEWQGEEFQSRTGIRFNFENSVGEIRLKKQIAVGLFRIFQEALTNVARHSGASSVTVRLATFAEVLRMEVRDDGIGISGGPMSLPTSLGLLGMRERATQIGGQFKITRNKRGGTCVSVELPWKMR